VSGEHRGALRLAILGFAIATCVSCTRAELVHKADAYDAAIWDSNNRQILANALRASQRAPMSFVGLGDVAANPVVSGSTTGTFGFIPAGLSAYSFSPTVSYGGGFATFNMSNLNQKEFAEQMHVPIKDSIINHFMAEKWPKELVDLVLTQSIVLTSTEFADISRRRRLVCDLRSDARSAEICDIIDADLAFYREACPHGNDSNPVFLNTAREHCAMARFQILVRSLRLLDYKVHRRENRSAEGILYYLGELIAAQLYSSQPYMPRVMLQASDGRHHLMRMFVVERGSLGPPAAAVRISFNGEDFFIPRPQLGDIEEDRSLEVLDMAATAIVLATNKDILPKSNNVNLINTR
jgi:hypothetical protein